MAISKNCISELDILILPYTMEEWHLWNVFANNGYQMNWDLLSFVDRNSQYISTFAQNSLQHRTPIYFGSKQ